MRLFIRNVLISFCLFILIIFSVNYLWNYIINSPDSYNTVFIWGDSQVYRGLDLRVLEKESKKNIITSAKHGSGVYDFLIFSENVPPKSIVLLSISKPVQLRAKEFDRNLSGVSLTALKILLSNNYSWNEIFTILKKNKIPSNIFNKYNEMYTYSDTFQFPDTLRFTGLIPTFKKVYKEIPYYLDSKQKIILEGIKLLKKKNCKISFIQFPYHKFFQKMEGRSEVRFKTGQFDNDMLNLFEEFKIDTIQLDKNKEVMFDFTHLNEFGASETSHKLAELIRNQEHTTMYIVKWR